MVKVDRPKQKGSLTYLGCLSPKYLHILDIAMKTMVDLLFGLRWMLEAVFFSGCFATRSVLMMWLRTDVLRRWDRLVGWFGRGGVGKREEAMGEEKREEAMGGERGRG